MTLKANALQIIVIVATVIRERNDMVYLVAWLQSPVALALLAQSAIALEYPLSDGHPSAASNALGHLFSSQPLRICRPTARYVLRCWVTTFRRVRMQKTRASCECRGLMIFCPNEAIR